MLSTAISAHPAHLQEAEFLETVASLLALGLVDDALRLRNRFVLDWSGRASGRYRDTLVRCPDDRWRLKERLPEIEAVRAQAPLGAEPFPDSAAMRQATAGASPPRSAQA